MVGPLIDEINGHAVTAARDILIVTEGETHVVQEDFRDEVYCVLRGSPSKDSARTLRFRRKARTPSASDRLSWTPSAS